MTGTPTDSEIDRVAVAAWPATLAEMTDIATAELERDGVMAELAHRYARRAVLAIAFLFGGRAIYLPTGEKLRRAIRDNEIYTRANASNLAELAAEYGITVTSVYAVIARQRALRRTARKAPTKPQHSARTGVADDAE